MTPQESIIVTTQKDPAVLRSTGRQPKHYDERKGETQCESFGKEHCKRKHIEGKREAAKTNAGTDKKKRRKIRMKQGKEKKQKKLAAVKQMHNIRQRKKKMPERKQTNRQKKERGDLKYRKQYISNNDPGKESNRREREEKEKNTKKRKRRGATFGR